MNGQCALSVKFVQQGQTTPTEGKRMASGYDGHISKRQRTDNSDRDDDRINPAPSPVVHVRGLTDLVTEGNLMQAVQHFGVVSYVMMMSRKHMALIEFENITGARNCVEYSQHNQIFVGDHPAFFNYSTSSKIQRPSGEAGEVKSANHILLYTVLNPQYPITVDVMHTINSPYGQVQRIVIFKKNGVQAMVEFESIDSAKRAKQNLNGADIYSGCCTLKIEFAKPTRLNVIRNDQDSWDYTNPNLGKEPQGQQGRPAPLLQDPRYSNIPTPYEQKMNSGYGGQAPPQGGGGSGYQGQGGYSGPPQQGYGSPQGGYSPPGSGGYGMYDQGDGYGGYPPSSSRQYDMGPPSDRYSSSKPPMHDRGYGRPPSTYSDGPPPPGGSMIQGSVLMVYGLDMERINCDKLFNLFCLYGNVVRIKFLKSKEGSAMIQMGDSLALERCMQNLNYIHFFGSKVQLGHSKQAFLQDVPNPHELPDGSPSFKDFMGSRNNRFANPEAAAKNRIMSPTKTLHYFNAPPGLTKEEIEEMFEKCGTEKPTKIKQFNTKNERSSTGLLQFDSKGDAMEALISVNHYSLPNPTGKNPFIFKVCFSGTTVDRERD